MYIYLHVPFCVSRCIYCDFYVVLEKYGGQDAYVDAVCREIDARLAGLDAAHPPQEIQTLYVGGGTPSLLPAKAYRRILSRLNRYLPLSPQAEITLEANPGARQSEMADEPQAYLEAGFNRISVGVQSFQDAELKKLSRIHSADEAEAFIRRLQRAGWKNISVDLMYGLPRQTMASWQDTLGRAIALDVQHVSMYGLKIEAQTPLEKLALLPEGGYAVPEEEENVAMYFEGIRQLEAAGLARYEFSNLARPGYASRHNLNYWDTGEFLALGVAAHGYWQGHRYETVRDVQAYLQDPLASKSSPVSAQEQLENAIIFGLRKAEGIHIPTLERRFGIDFRRRYARILAQFAGDALILSADRLKLSESAIPLSNVVLAEFLD